MVTLRATRSEIGNSSSQRNTDTQIEDTYGARNANIKTPEEIDRERDIRITRLETTQAELVSENKKRNRISTSSIVRLLFFFNLIFN